MIRKILTYLKAIFLIALVVFLYGFASTRNEHKKVEGILIEFENGENLYMNRKMVNKLLIQNSETVLKQPKSVIDLHSLEKSILAHPMVQEAHVSLTIDGLIKAKVKQRKPIARVIVDEKSYYIDIQGKAMPLSELYSARVPIITGESIIDNLSDIHYLLEKISNNDFLNKNVIGIHRYKSNEYELITRVGDQIIEIGNTKELDQKIKNLEAFYKKGIQDSLIGNYNRINVKFYKQVVCTKKEQHEV
ncbi:MAG: cell division protein FtsQ [Flavobacteriaceae bacterium]|nr:cell division protein FtsQ [Flavobacteriaceae bacterium]